MIAIFILLFSAMALVQFFMSYCRSLLAGYAKAELSPVTRKAMGIQSGEISGGEFDRLLGLVRIASDRGDDRVEIGIVTLYYRIVRFIGAVISPVAPSARIWAERESGHCAYFAAVALDRRIASATQS
jgi:hypothetical protein